MFHKGYIMTIYPASIEVMLYLVYDIESMLSTIYQKDTMKIKVTCEYIDLDLCGMCLNLAHLHETKSPYLHRPI